MDTGCTPCTGLPCHLFGRGFLASWLAGWLAGVDELVDGLLSLFAPYPFVTQILAQSVDVPLELLDLSFLRQELFARGTVGSFLHRRLPTREVGAVVDAQAFGVGHEIRKGDAVTLDLDMPAVRIAADPRVREDAGKVAVTRGPLVYCLEECDNGKDLHLVRLPHDAAFPVQEASDLPGGVLDITAEGLRESTDWPEDRLYAPATPRQAQPQTLAFIPYYAWANRGIGEMTVWVREG